MENYGIRYANNINISRKATQSFFILIFTFYTLKKPPQRNNLLGWLKYL